ncbi:MAG: hypothetical protein HOD60_01685 [Candidatus Nitrosopelagicus sp.]|jgi:hypothetical protein|nr:hypothetical protein [Candidatus Nitrosopelagicus sp.]
MSDDVDNLPAPIFEKCTILAKIRDRIHKGEDMLMVIKDESEERRNEHEVDNQNRINESSNNQYKQPRYTKNIESLYHLTMEIQEKINMVNDPPTPRRIRDIQMVNRNIERFFESGIDNYADDLVVYIESLVIDEGFDPSYFHGYTRLVKMIKDTQGMKKKSYLLSLMNKVRQVIPPDISTTPIHVIEPSISKSSNPSDA